MKKVLKITESQYNRIFLNEEVLRETESLLNEQKPDYLMPGQPDRPGTDMYKAIRKKDQESMKALGNLIYDVFDCSKLRDESSWLDYGHCVVDNVSMAVSVVPVIGTAASGVLDLINSVVYLGEAIHHSSKGELGKASASLGFAGLSALGIIPGVTEFKALTKASKGVMKNTDNILKELSKQSIKKGDIKKVDQVIEKYSKGLSDVEKKQLGEVINILSTPQAKEGIKNMGRFNDFTKKFMLKFGLKKYQLRTLIGSKDFNKILKDNGGDIYKALNANETKKLISNIIAQSVSVAGMVGLTKGIESYLKTKSSKTQETYISMITDSKKSKELEKMGENEHLQLIDSIEKNGGEMSDDEFWSTVGPIGSSDAHVIESGENLSSIAKKYGMKWTELYDKNRDIIEKTQKKYGGVKTCNKTYCKGRETPSPEHIYKGTTLKIK
jgi:hypothetical protein